MVSLPDYAELHCRSNFSFLQGASHPEELVEQALKLGYKALAITDECSLSGVARAHIAAKNSGLKIIIGSEFRFTDGLRLVVLAMTRQGYGNLSHVISLARRASEKGAYRLSRQDIHRDTFLQCIALWLPQNVVQRDVARDNDELNWLKSRFPQRLWLAAELLLGGNDTAQLRYFSDLAAKQGLPLCAAGDVCMHKRGRRMLQDVLTAIRLGCSVKDLGLDAYSNAERYLRPRGRLSAIYPEKLLQSAVDIAALCEFSLDELRYEYPHELVPESHTAASWLSHLVEEGMYKRWPKGVPPKIKAMIRHELALVSELCYEHYFLTVWDIVAFARSQGILCQGRGSAANSVICYCLEITEVDPSRMQLLFERFISRERNEPPDIDVDFEHERREEVIQYIYRKYGRHRAALTATVICYRPRSAIRDVGKALGLSLEQVDRLAKNFYWWQDAEAARQQVIDAGFDPDNPTLKRLLLLLSQILGFPRHLSQHVGGFVISEGELSRLVPIENASMPERTVIQWEKNDLDALGLLKIDVLALGMLSAIRKALAYISEYQGKTVGLKDIPAEDAAVYRMIQKADTVGVFQIESRAQMSMLPRLRPANYYDLVIQIAIVRPGPIQGDMVHPYLQRRMGREKPVYHSEAVKNVLQRTLGVPIFQEQVMQMAIVAAGFTPGEADRLRRAMAAWKRRGGLEPFEKKLLHGMKQRGYPEEYARQIFNQIKGFGDYGFPESHSASFALLAYASSWLKYYHPAAFTCALINSQPMGFYGVSQLAQDARRHGVQFLPVDINHSEYDCHLPAKTGHKTAQTHSIRLGLRLVKGLSEKAARDLVAQRQNAAYRDTQDLASRTGMSKHDLEALAAAGSLHGLVGNRHQAYWQVSGVEESTPIFPQPQFNEATAMLPTPSEGADIIADYRHLGLSLGRHPLALLRSRLQPYRVLSAEALWEKPNDSRVRVAGLVVCRQRPATAKNVVFVTLEDETGQANVIVWPKLAETQHKVLVKASMMLVYGRIQQNDGVLHVIAEKLEDWSHRLNHLDISRNWA